MWFFAKFWLIFAQFLYCIAMPQQNDDYYYDYNYEDPPVGTSNSDYGPNESSDYISEVGPGPPPVGICTVGVNLGHEGKTYLISDVISVCSIIFDMYIFFQDLKNHL